MVGYWNRVHASGTARQTHQDLWAPGESPSNSRTMKRKFIGETCVYCGRAAADTSDHVVGRNFFLVDRRGNLPQVPACRRCNGFKAELENYLMAVLPFGAKHHDAVANLKTLVAHRLEHPSNAKLRRKLQMGFDRSGGESIAIDSDRAEKLFAMIARGLAWHHFGVRLGDGFSAIAAVFSRTGEALFTRMLSSGRKHVADDLGDGTFTYEGTQGEYPEQTVWRFAFYGGVDFGGDPRVPEASSLAVAFTGRAEVIQNLRYQDFRKDAKPPKVGRNDPCPCGSGKKHKKCHGAT
jgi:hypothetical protein